MSIDTPIFRLVARNSGDPSSGLRVEATYALLGLVRTKTVSTVYGGSNWAPSQQMSTVLSLSTIVGTADPERDPDPDHPARQRRQLAGRRPLHRPLRPPLTPSSARPTEPARGRQRPARALLRAGGP